MHLYSPMVFMYSKRFHVSTEPISNVCKASGMMHKSVETSTGGATNIVVAVVSAIELPGTSTSSSSSGGVIRIGVGVGVGVGV